MNAEDKSREICRKLHITENGPEFVLIRLALIEHGLEIRNACAESIAKFSREVAKANTYRGRVNQIATHVCDHLDMAHGIIVNTSVS